MLALIIPLEGLLIYLLLRCLLPERDWRESILATYVVLGVLITGSTEILGAFHAITDIAIRFFWLILLVLTLILIYRFRPKKFHRPFPINIGGRFEWAIFLIISAYFLVTLFVALIAPPNTNDSLQYHMSRVMHWIVDRSVAFYATPIDRQLWMPPFAEYSILHWFLLAGNDRFVNLVQWFGMAGSAIAVASIARQIGVGARGQWFAALFAVTIPMGILQSTSTQTDYVAAFWCLCVIYFVISECRMIIAKEKWKVSLNTILLGLSLSLGMLTKGSIYAFVIPVLLYYLLVLVRKWLWKAITGIFLIFASCILILNAPQWFRNYSIFDSILGPGVGSVGSSTYDPRLVFSTLLKDATNQLALPAGPGNKAMYLVVMKIHQILGIDVNDPRTSLNDYRIHFSYQEDFAGNPGHFIFWILSTLWVFSLLLIRFIFPDSWKRLNFGQVAENYSSTLKPVLIYSLGLIAGYFLFALLFKWQSYGSRLLLPLLVAIGPLAGWMSETVKPRILFVLLTVLFAIGGLRYLFENPSRPLISVGGNESILLASRTNVQFYNSPEVRDGYISVVVAAKDYDCGFIGLELDSNTPEYLIWYILAANHMPVQQVENISSTLETNRLVDPAFRPCIVFCNTCSIVSMDNEYQQVYNRGSLQFFVKRSSQ